MNVFTFQDYRALLHHVVEERRLLEPSFTYQRLAEAAGVQRAYFSKVLSRQAQLSQDQLFLIAKFMHWTERETDYVAVLLELDRCEVSERKRALQKKCETLRKESEVTKDAVLLNAYASTPSVALLHQSLRIARYLKNPERVVEELRISREEWQFAMNLLSRLGILRQRNGRWELLQSEPLSLANAVEQRLLEEKSKQKLIVEEKTHAFLRHIVMRQEQFERLQKKLTELEQETLNQSAGTDLFTLNIELVDWRR